MEYQVNESGDIKVRTEKGVEKWLPKHLVENKFLMKSQGLEIVPVAIFVNIEAIINNSEVAEVAKAKTGNKTKK